MPDIRQNRHGWLMRYEYGAMVNVPSEKGSGRRLEPLK
jgi:hypothetical protein